MKKITALVMVAFGINAMADSLWEIDYPKAELKQAQKIYADKVYMYHRDWDDAWYWVTGDDWTPFAYGSIVKGWRLGVTSENKNNYFVYSSDASYPWSLTKSHTHRCIIRTTGAQSCEKDQPQTAPAPTCKLSVDKETAVIGEGISVSWEITGRAEKIRVNGREHGVHDEVILVATHEGKLHLKGEVYGPDGKGTCSADVTVEKKKEEPPPPVTKPSCTLTASPSKVVVGDSLVLEIALEGQIDEAVVDGEKLDLKVLKRIRTPHVTGTQTALASVKGPNGTSTCWTQYEVVAR